MATPQEQESREEQTEFAADAERSAEYTYANEAGVAEESAAPAIDRDALRAQMQQQMQGVQPEDDSNAAVGSEEALDNPAEEDLSIPTGPIEMASPGATPRSINFGVVGWGQGGSRLTEQFYKFEYK